MPATSALPILLSLLIRKDVRAPRALSFPTTMPVCLPLQGTAICKTEGLPLDHPLPLSADFSETEQEKAQAVLRSVIKHWGALGEVTTAQLQHSFFVREGRRGR